MEATVVDSPRPGDSLSSVARARTLTVLPRLDGDRKARIVQFLYESGLISTAHPVLDLSGADLRWANLYGANLRRADLGKAYLYGADLAHAQATEEQLEEAFTLKGATLPQGQKYEGWLKNREGRKEDTENE